MFISRSLFFAMCQWGSWVGVAGLREGGREDFKELRRNVTHGHGIKIPVSEIRFSEVSSAGVSIA